MTLPIPTEHLPAVVAALRANGVAYLNVRTGYAATYPPPKWRSLADARCETCDGSGSIEGRNIACYDACPDDYLLNGGGCHNGKPIHTLTVECDECANGHVTCPKCGNYYEDEPGFSDSFQHGTVSVDVVVAELVKVELNQFASRDHSHIALTRDSEAYHVNAEGGHRHITPLGPPLTPGDWVAVLRKVER